MNGKLTAHISYTPSMPCLTCSSWATASVEPCFGYYTFNLQWAFCTWASLAGGLREKPGKGFCHKLIGRCACGDRHDGVGEPFLSPELCLCGCGTELDAGQFAADHDVLAALAVIAKEYPSTGHFLRAHRYGPGHRSMKRLMKAWRAR